ncbi:little elongation complex subunit 1 isoform X2 [Pogoniulus pusillus]
MLQKILPLEKCQEELGSLKAELEEKKCSLKIYRESQLEYVKIKEEIVNSDAVRKKLETKVKKLEEAATKRTQDFRQLKTEKKRLEKELKKAQGKLDGVLQEKCRKVKHAETQSSSEDLKTDIDKEKIKLLLEELWMCIDSATGKRKARGKDPVWVSTQDKTWPEKRRLTVTEDSVQFQHKIRKCDGTMLPCYSSLEGAGKQNSGAAVQLQVSTEPFGGDCVESRTPKECQRGGEDKPEDMIVQTDVAHSSSDFSDQEENGSGGSVMDILNWTRPLPALLSPIQLSPLTTQDVLFGDVTSSSDEEVDCSASAVENILQEEHVEPQSCDVFSLGEECSRQSKSCEHGGLHADISRNLRWNEKMSSKEESDAETEQTGAATLISNMETNRGENSEYLETEKRSLTETREEELEAIENQKGDSEGMHSEEERFSADITLHNFNPQTELERCSEVEQTEESAVLVGAVDYEGTHNTHSTLTRSGQDALSGETQTPRAGSVPQNVTHLPPEQCVVLQSEHSKEKSDVLIQNEVVENESKHVIKASDLEEKVKQAIIGEEMTAAVQVEANNERELSENVLSDFSSSKSFSEVNCPEDVRIQLDGEGIITESEADTGSVELFVCSQHSEIKHKSEEILEEQCMQTIKDEQDREYEPETVKVSRDSLPLAVVEGVRNSLSVDNIDKSVGIEWTALSAFTKDDEHLKIEDVNITRPENIELALKYNGECVLEIAESSELLHRAENTELADISEGQCLKGKALLEENGSDLSQEKSELESVLALPKMASTADAESSVAMCESSVLDVMALKGEIKQPENLCSPFECGLSKPQNFGVLESQETEFKDHPEDVAGESSEQLEQVGTDQSVLVESSLTSPTEFAKPLNYFLVAENVKCDEIKGELNEQSQELVTETCSSSINWEENGMKKNISEIICSPTSEMDFNGSLAFSTQEDLEMGCINTEETDSAVQVGIALESTVPPYLNGSLQKDVSLVETNSTEKAASHTQETKGDKNSVSALNCSSGGLDAESNNMYKELDCPERESEHKNDVKIPHVNEQPVGKEPQATVKSHVLDADSYNENTLAVSHLRADTVMDIDTCCETNNLINSASELPSEVGEDYPVDLASWTREGTLVTSENREDTTECVLDSNRADSDSEGILLKTKSSKESLELPNASKNRLPVGQMLTGSSETCSLAEDSSALNTKTLAVVNLLGEKDSEKLQSNVEQNLLLGVDMGIPASEECHHHQTGTICSAEEANTNVMLDGSSREKPVKHLPTQGLSGVEGSCQRVTQPSEPQKAVPEELPVLESESYVDVALKTSNELCRKQEPSEILTVPAETAAQVVHAKPSKRLFQSKRRALKAKRTQPVVANANTPLPVKCSSENINQIRQEMGPPLPPLLLPLVATPPKAACTMPSALSSADPSSLLSPLDELISPLRDTPVPPLMSPLTDTPPVKSALLFSPASPSEAAAGRRTRSSPLKFCTSIPKHALPVPGRFPLLAADGAAPGAPPENSVRILDTMYPELSARARTLNILKGNIQLGRCAFADSQSLSGPVAQIGGFQAIASKSTAFVKTGSTLKAESHKEQDRDGQNQQSFPSSSNHLEKGTLLPASMPRSAKRLRLDSEPSKLELNDAAAVRDTKNRVLETQEAFHDTSCEISEPADGSSLETSLPVNKAIDLDSQNVSLALKKIAESCFDLLPVIKGHVYVGNTSKIPVMRDEEKEVVYEFGVKNKHLAESLLHGILNKLKAQKNATNYNINQALCRVYTGVCRQLGDLERARLLCYSLLKEGFPDSDKLTLFITNVWPDIFVFQGAINEAMQLVARQNASDDVLPCLGAYLNWEQSSSLDAATMVSNLLLEMQSCAKVELQLSEQYGEDLSEDAWQYIFAVDLLCSHLKWDWTHDNVISKVLWPSMDQWIKKRKAHESSQSIPDSVIALILRLIGRLSHIGVKEGCLAAVKNISSVIGLFVQHAQEEGVPWGVQLAAVYSLCDLASSNPGGSAEAIRAWKATVPNAVPVAVTNGIAEITSVCKMELN